MRDPFYNDGNSHPVTSFASPESAKNSWKLHSGVIIGQLQSVGLQCLKASGSVTLRVSLSLVPAHDSLRVEGSCNARPCGYDMHAYFVGRVQWQRQHGSRTCNRTNTCNSQQRMKQSVGAMFRLLKQWYNA